MRRNLYCFDACYIRFSIATTTKTVYVPTVIFSLQLIYSCRHLMSPSDSFISIFLIIFSSFLLTVTTVSTPVSEITTLSLQSDTNVPASSSPTPFQSTSTHSTVSSSSLPLLPDIDVTTVSSEPSRTDESLKVLPLNLANKTILSDDKDDSTTMTSTTESAMTVNLSEAKIKPEIISESEGTTMTKERLVNNESDNQANLPQPELVAGEMNEKSRSNQEKEGRAINFPMGISSNNQSSTAPGHMQGSINFVTTSTEKTHVISFFDLSDVNMDHDDAVNEQREMETKDTRTTTDKQTAEPTECSHNGSMYKASGT